MKEGGGAGGRRRRYGAYKALIKKDVVESKKDMEESLKNEKHILLKYFEDFRKWTKEETCQTCRVWGEYLGILLHAWSTNTIRKIGKLWGTVVGLDKETEDGETLT